MAIKISLGMVCSLDKLGLSLNREQIIKVNSMEASIARGFHSYDHCNQTKERLVTQ
jgi:tRNA-binding EMAP/Myf-like protein